MSGLGDLIAAAGNLISSAIKVVVALALFVFLWGLARFIFRVSGDDKELEEGKNIMKWGLIALFVMVSVWGIVVFMQTAFGLEGSSFW